MEALDVTFSWIVGRAYELLKRYALCDHCLGRMFALLGRGWSNAERGDAIKRSLVMAFHALIREGKVKAISEFLELAPNIGAQAAQLYRELVGRDLPERTCYLCGSTLGKALDILAHKAVDALRGYDAKSFLLAAIVSDEVRKKEDDVKLRFGLHYAESLGAELKREVSKRIQSLTSLRPDFSRPHVVLELKFPDLEVNVIPMPLFVRGVYKKLSRRISQSIWLVGDVKKYPLSVEEAVQLLARVAGGERAVLHAAGREDVDVRMLGSGRPFIAEVKRPRKWELDLNSVQEELNVFYHGLARFTLSGYACRRDIAELKESGRSVKVYRALVLSSGDINEDELRILEKRFKNVKISQRTPRRVRHRRPDVIRERMVYEVRARLLGPKAFECLVRCEGGLYVKELVDGDGGDTSPSFAEVLGKELYCAELDVVLVERMSGTARE